jgi:hypothetical protein
MLLSVCIKRDQTEKDREKIKKKKEGWSRNPKRLLYAR